MCSAVNFMLYILYHNQKKASVNHSDFSLVTVQCGSPGSMIGAGEETVSKAIGWEDLSHYLLSHFIVRKLGLKCGDVPSAWAGVVPQASHSPSFPWRQRAERLLRGGRQCHSTRAAL